MSSRRCDANQANFFTRAVFDTVDANHLAFGVRDLFMVTVLSSMCALVLGVPIAVGIAVFLTRIRAGKAVASVRCDR